MTWWRRLLTRGKLEQDLDKELRFHFDRLVDDHVRAGLPIEEARRLARLEFGGVEQLKEDCRDARATRWAHDVAQDLRFALRVLRKDPMFTGVAVMALALGIGVNSLFFTVVNAFCVRGPLRDPSGLVHLGTRAAAGAGRALSHHDFVEIRNAVPALNGTAAYATAPMAVSDDVTAPERVTGAYVSANAFAIVGETPHLGRDFAAEDDQAGAPRVALLSMSLWKRRFVGDPGILGRTFRIDGEPATAVGVMRDGFRFPNDAEVWLPLASMPKLATGPNGARVLGVFGRLAADAAVADVDAQLEVLGGRLAQNYPAAYRGPSPLLTAEPINERFTGSITNPAWLAFIVAGGLVLLVACANVANLLLGRALERSSEVAMRAALGATRWRIVRQLLVECAILAVAGAAAGVLLSFAGARLMSAAIPQGTLPSWITLTMDGRVLALLGAVCAATTFLFGFVPAIHTSKASLTHVLRARARGLSTGAGARRWTTAFMTVQFALTFVLLSTVVHGLRLDSDPPDVVALPEPAKVLTTLITLPARHAGVAARHQFYERVLRETSTIPGVTAASIASALPFGGASQHGVVIEGRESTAADSAERAGGVSVDPRYFDSCGVAIVEGRGFSAADGTTGQGAVIVNRRFAQQFFPGASAIGRRIRLTSPGIAVETLPWLSVVGVAPNLPQGPGGGAIPLAYQPFRVAAPATAALMLRGDMDATAAAGALRDRLQRLDPDLPTYRTLTLERVITDAQWNPRLSSAIVNSISTIALILAIVGLYGVTTHAVTARAREIGIRAALGATPGHVRRLVLGRAMRHLTIGIAAGIAGTIAWNRIFNVSTAVSALGMTHPAVLATVAALIATIGIAACLVPARRAVRLDPLATIRSE